MRGVAARLVLLISLCLTAGCSNRVVSDQPWSDQADIVSPSPFRDGLWLVDAVDCTVDADRPAEQWPECANWQYVRGQTSFTLKAPEGVMEDPRVPVSRNWVEQWSALIVGEPMIGQQANCNLTEMTNDEENASPVYCDDAIVPTARDRQGQIIAFQSWPIMCGPDDNAGPVTQNPWSGLTIRRENCLADDMSALRNAAMQTRGLPDADAVVTTVRWVRDGYR